MSVAIPGDRLGLGVESGASVPITLGEVGVLCFFLLALVFPEFSQQHSIRLGSVGVLYLHDLVFLALVLLAFRPTAQAVLQADSRDLTPMRLFIVLIGLEAALGAANGNPPTYLLREMRFLGYSAFFFLAVAIYPGKERRFFALSLLVAGLVALRGLFEQATGAPLINNEFSSGDVLPGVLTGDVAAIRSYTSPILLFAILYAFSRVTKNRSAKHFVLLVLCVGSVAFSFARNLYMGVIIAWLLLLAFEKRKVRGSVVATGGLVIAGGILGVLLGGGGFWREAIGRLMMSFSLGDLSAVGRVLEYGEAFSVFRNHPLFGAGLGYRLDYWMLPTNLQGITDIHNTYLYFLAKCGIVGLAIFLVVLVRYARIGVSRLRDDPLFPVILASIVGYAVMFAFAHHLSGGFFGAWFFALLGTTHLLNARARQGATPRD